MPKGLCHSQLLLLSLVITALCTAALSNPVGPAEQDNSKRKKELFDDYNLGKARKKGAIEDALNFLVRQESQGQLIPNATASKSGGIGDDVAVVVGSESQHTGELPLCQVSADRIEKELTFTHRGATLPPYDHHCWLMRTRYNVAEVCENKEKQLKQSNIWEWQYTFESALQGKCKMPDPSPPAVAKEFLRLNSASTRIPTSKSKYKNDNGKVLNVLALGLSFMGQPIMSLGCLYSHMVTDGVVWRKEKKGDKDSFGSVKEIRENNGICSGYFSPNITDMFPSRMNPNRAAPRQNVHECSADHSMVEYVDPKDPSLPKVRVCYRYTFNVEKNWKPLSAGGKNPCGWDWSDVDVAIGFIEYDELQRIMLPRSGAVIDQLKHLKVININRFYSALIENKLKKAAKAKGMEIVDIRAKPNNCNKPDIHFRLPGIPDVAIQLWFSMIATGLQTFNGCTNDESCKKYTRKMGPIEYWE